jgi:hypothetical protein
MEANNLTASQKEVYDHQTESSNDDQMLPVSSTDATENDEDAMLPTGPPDVPQSSPPENEHHGISLDLETTNENDNSMTINTLLSSGASSPSSFPERNTDSSRDSIDHHTTNHHYPPSFPRPHVNSDSLHSSLRDNIREHALIRQQIFDLEEVASNRFNQVNERISKLIAGKIQRLINIVLENAEDIKDNAVAAEAKVNKIKRETSAKFQEATKDRNNISKNIERLRTEVNSFKSDHDKEINNNREQLALDKGGISKITDTLLGTMNDLTDKASQPKCNGSDTSSAGATKDDDFKLVTEAEEYA